MKKVILILFAMIAVPAFAQTEQKQPGTGIDNSIHQLATIDQKPELAGDMTFDQFFKKNFHSNVKFTAPLKIVFTVERNGFALNVKVFGDDDAATIQEIARIVKAAGKWKPGMKDGKTVRVMYSYLIKS